MAALCDECCHGCYFAVSRWWLVDVLEQAPSNGESGHHDAHHAHELDEDVEARACGVLEGVAYGVAHDGGLVNVAALTAEVAFLHVLLGIVPRTA